MPLLRTHLVAAAPRYPLPVNLSVDLLPIVEDGLFGYELVPDRGSRTCLTLAFDVRGVPVVRKTTYGADESTVLRLAFLNGAPVTRNAPDIRRTRQRDFRFSDLPSAAESTWAELVTLFHDKPRRPVELDETLHRVLDGALNIAHSHLAAWDPSIDFCGIPNEAQQGFALRGAHGASGELVSTRPDMWILRWKSPPDAVYEEWSMTVPGSDAVDVTTRA